MVRSIMVWFFDVRTWRAHPLFRFDGLTLVCVAFYTGYLVVWWSFPDSLSVVFLTQSSPDAVSDAFNDVP